MSLVKVQPITPPETRRWLLHVARRSLADALGVCEGLPHAPYRPADPQLDLPAATFVSWHAGPRLVGCIGTLQAQQALETNVRTYAVEAGLHDPRTSPATVDQLPGLSCEVSILGDPEPMEVVGATAIGRALVPGRDGLVIREGDRRAVFLPVVWDMLPEPAAFVAALCRKAGIDLAREGSRVFGETFRAEKFGDDGVLA